MVYCTNPLDYIFLGSDVEDLSDNKGSKACSYFKQSWLSNISYYSLGLSKHCLLKSDCRPNNCTFMAGMSSIRNHVTAAFFPVEIAMRLGLTNPACEWLPKRKDAQRVKIKDLNFNRDDFTKRGKKRKNMLFTPKRNYNPLINNIQTSTLTFLDTAAALESHSRWCFKYGITETKIDIVGVVDSVREISSDITCMDENILMYNSVDECFANVKVNFSITSID